MIGTDDGPGDLTLDALTAGISVYQRAKGHRFSSDDVVTAWLALQVCPLPGRALDLGCGLGSVLLHVAWSAPEATLVGVEAQDVSFALAVRNVAHNGLEDRVRLHHGDLRDPDVIATVGGPFDLITGTPPYFPPDAAVDSADPQRALARIEHRGGIEAYTQTAARLLAPGGWFVVCGDAGGRIRLERAAADCALAICQRCTVIPRAGRAALFTVWALRHHADATHMVTRSLTLRDHAGERTDDAKALRAFSGFAERPPA